MRTVALFVSLSLSLFTYWRVAASAARALPVPKRAFNHNHKEQDAHIAAFEAVSVNSTLARGSCLIFFLFLSVLMPFDLLPVLFPSSTLSVCVASSCSVIMEAGLSLPIFLYTSDDSSPVILIITSNFTQAVCISYLITRRILIRVSDLICCAPYVLFYFVPKAPWCPPIQQGPIQPSCISISVVFSSVYIYRCSSPAPVILSHPWAFKSREFIHYWSDLFSL